MLNTLAYNIIYKNLVKQMLYDIKNPTSLTLTLNTCQVIFV